MNRSNHKTKRDRLANRRSGLSLIEVILSVAIFVGSAAVIGQLVSIGQRMAIKADESTVVQKLCFNKMNELMAGIEPLEAVQQQPIAFDSPWNYSVAIRPIGIRDLLEVTVSISESAETLSSDSMESTNATPIAQIANTRPAFHLTRWIDPGEREVGAFELSTSSNASASDESNPISERFSELEP